jgi:hypothetical protein
MLAAKMAIQGTLSGADNPPITTVLRQVHAMDRTGHTPPCSVLLLLAGTMLLAADTATAQPQPCATARTPYADWTFFGYACTDACREQKAGFAWAERNGIADMAACAAQAGGRAQGCLAYAGAVVTAEQAGFEWARENEVTDRCACAGAGRGFRAGCEVYLETTAD